MSQRNTSPGGRKRASTRSKYASRACQECRRRRAKCDGEKPSCARCLQRGIECVYNTGDENRGTAPRSLVRLLQARIKKLEDILWLHSIDINIPVDHTDGNDIPVNDKPADLTRSTASHQAHSKFDNPSCTDGHLNFDDHGEAFYFGSSSGRAELLRPTEGANEDPGLSLNTFPRFPHNMYSQAVDSTLEISKELQEHLVSLYFEWEQPWFQLVDETLFRESWNENGRYSNPLLLNCIFALGSRYSDRTEVRSNPEDPNTAGQLFLELAEVLLHFDLKSPSIITIQSLAMMAILYVALMPKVGYVMAWLFD
ncbi:hypothetical protein PCG10_001949 [Penicillium crustosum]|uniref:Zn(2)-C6 fungal-type domain-containing protein n=1 Tax=Penicillium crustosum TaxID=36656 RepID=A0A9P5GCE0_PENCR|nr:hypothetical protein PCG10_001949 [Penicillium crustosum]